LIPSFWGQKGRAVQESAYLSGTNEISSQIPATESKSHNVKKTQTGKKLRAFVWKALRAIQIAR
jgi:hypothetical protein